MRAVAQARQRMRVSDDVAASLDASAVWLCLSTFPLPACTLARTQQL
jgi:hypothetical protein